MNGVLFVVSHSLKDVFLLSRPLKIFLFTVIQLFNQ